MDRSARFKSILKKLDITEEQYKLAFENSSIYRKVLNAVIEDKLDLEPSPINTYEECQAWAYRRADKDGSNRALLAIKKYL